MSIKATNWVWEKELPPSRKLVLMALADIADDRGYSFPAVPTLAVKVCMDERSVQRALRKLKGEKLLSIERRFCRDGSQTSNGYRLPIDTPVAICHRQPDGDVTGEAAQSSPDRWHRGHRDGGIDAALTTTEPTIYPSQEPPHGGQPEVPTPVDSVQDGGVRGLCFPQGLSSAQRRGLAGQLGPLDRENAQQLLDELAGRMARTQVVSPGGYLRALIQRLNCGTFEPELALQVAQRRQSQEPRNVAAAAPESAGAATTVSSPRRVPESIRLALKVRPTKALG
jgi:hypothetical protein